VFDLVLPTARYTRPASLRFLGGFVLSVSPLAQWIFMVLDWISERSDHLSGRMAPMSVACIVGTAAPHGAVGFRQQVFSLLQRRGLHPFLRREMWLSFQFECSLLVLSCGVGI
jgi:hypothetical protein